MTGKQIEWMDCEGGFYDFKAEYACLPAIISIAIRQKSYALCQNLIF